MEEKDFEQIVKEQTEYMRQWHIEEAKRVTVEDLTEALGILSKIVLGGE